jgi:hypothetical protein
MTFISESSHFFFLPYDIAQISQYLLKNYITCKRLDECFTEVVNDKKKAVAISRAHALNNPLNLHEGIDFVCFPVQENVVIYSAVMLFRKFHHLLDMVNEKIRTISESGLLSKWAMDSINVAAKSSTSSSGGGAHGSGGPQIKLKVEHVEGAFFVVLIGLGFALIAFIIELLVHKMIAQKRHVKWMRKIERVLCYA